MVMCTEQPMLEPTVFYSDRPELISRFNPADQDGLVLNAQAGCLSVSLGGELLIEGACVPVPSGLEQRSGAASVVTVRGTDFGPAGDCMELELQAAYPSEAGLDYLRRRACLVRMEPAGQVIVRDDFRFAEEAGVLESRCYTTAVVEKAAPGYLRLHGANAVLAVRFDPAIVRFELAPGLLRFSMQAQKDSLILRFVPEQR